VLDKSNVPIGTIQRIFGHENRTKTEIHLQTIGDAKRDAMAVLEKIHTWGKKRLNFSGCNLLILLVSRSGIEPETY
jgi:hypothetical protein